MTQNDSPPDPDTSEGVADETETELDFESLATGGDVAKFFRGLNSFVSLMQDLHDVDDEQAAQVLELVALDHRNAADALADADRADSDGG